MEYHKPRLTLLDLAPASASCCNPTPYTPPGSCAPPAPPNPPSGPITPGNPNSSMCYFFGDC